MKSYPVKENHTDSVVSEILWYILLLYYKDLSLYIKATGLGYLKKPGFYQPWYLVLEIGQPTIYLTIKIIVFLV